MARTVGKAGFSGAQAPVHSRCYVAWGTCSMSAARTERLSLLVADGECAEPLAGGQ